MADVFLSYKREERRKAQQIASALEAEGFTVFYDVSEAGIQVGELWDVRLERELTQAKVVLALWSPASVASHNVRDEARRAHQRGVLVPVMLSACEPPLGLGTLQAADLSKWEGDRQDPEWRNLIQKGIERFIRPDPSGHAPAVAQAPQRLETPKLQVQEEGKFQVKSEFTLELPSREAASSIHFEYDNSVLIGTVGGRLHRLNIHNKSLVSLKCGASVSQIASLDFARAGQIAIDEVGRLWRFDFSKREVSQVRMEKGEKAIALNEETGAVSLVSRQGNRIRIYDVSKTLTLLASTHAPAEWGECCGFVRSRSVLVFLLAKLVTLFALPGVRGSEVTLLKPPSFARIAGHRVFVANSDGSVSRIADEVLDGRVHRIHRDTAPVLGGVADLAYTSPLLVTAHANRQVGFHMWGGTVMTNTSAPAQSVATRSERTIAGTQDGEIYCWKAGVWPVKASPSLHFS